VCNLYSVTKGQAAIVALTRAMRDTTGNLPPMPGVFPDYLAPIVRNAPDGVRELAARSKCLPTFGATSNPQMESRSQAEHFIRCPACGGWVECRDQAQALA